MAKAETKTRTKQERQANKERLIRLLSETFGGEVTRASAKSTCWTGLVPETKHPEHVHRSTGNYCTLINRALGWKVGRQLVAISGEFGWDYVEQFDIVDRYNMDIVLSERIAWAREHGLVWKWVPFPFLRDDSGPYHLVLINPKFDGRFDAALQRLMEREPR